MTVILGEITKTLEILHFLNLALVQIHANHPDEQINLLGTIGLIGKMSKITYFVCLTIVVINLMIDCLNFKGSGPYQVQV
jgi:hypothetical protein